MSGTHVEPLASGRPRMPTLMDVNDVVKNLKQYQIYDYLGLDNNKHLRAFLDGQKRPGAERYEDDEDHCNGQPERLMFSDLVSKINRKNKAQKRVLVITNKALYNFHHNKYEKCQRRISLRSLAVIIMSRCSEEVLFMPKNDYDYRYEISRRAEMLEMTNKAYHMLTGIELPVQFSEEKELRAYVRTKQDWRNAMKSSASTDQVNKSGRGGGGGGGSGGRSTNAGSGVAGSADGSGGGGDGATSNDAGDGSGSASGRAGAQGAQDDNTQRSGGGGGGGGDESKSSDGNHNNNRRKGGHHSRTHSALPTGVSSTASEAQYTTSYRLPGTVIESWLTKKKGRSEKWDRKFFVLTDQHLLYFTPGLKGKVSIAGCQVTVTESDADGDESKQSSEAIAAQGGTTTTPPKYLLEIKCNRRRKPLRVGTSSKADMVSWRDAFESGDKSKGKDKEPVHLEGWLLKKDPSSKNWRTRYFVVRDGSAFYFEMSLKNSISLTQGVSGHSSKTVLATEKSRTHFAGFTSQTRFAYRFNVSDARRLYNLAADTQQDMRKWIRAIEKASRKHTQGFEYKATLKNDEVFSEFLNAVTEKAPEGRVSFVFTDVQNSTNLWEAVPEAMDEALEKHDAILRELLKKYRGYEVKTEGDAFMVTFFSVLDATLWCLEAQRSLVAEEWPDALLQMPPASCVMSKDDPTRKIFSGIRIRMGIHVGNPNCRKNPVTGRMDYFGPVVNRSARVSDTGHGGQIVCTQEAYDELMAEREAKTREELAGDKFPLVHDLGEHHLKGIKELVRIYEVTPPEMRERHDIFPPIRTIDNEERTKNMAFSVKAKQGDTLDSDEEEGDENNDNLADSDDDDDDDDNDGDRNNDDAGFGRQGDGDASDEN